MFTIKPRKQGVTPELVQLFKEVGTSTIGHLTDFGFIQGLTPLFRPVHFVGNAVTVRIPQQDSVAVHLALDIVEPGDILIIDMSGTTNRSCFGGMVAYAAKKKGIAGVIVSGCVNDVDEINELGLPVYSLGVSALTTRFLGNEGEINTPISIGGVSIEPGDLVVADSDGIFVMDAISAKNYGEIAIEKQSTEPGKKKLLDNGVALSTISKADRFLTEKAPTK